MILARHQSVSTRKTEASEKNRKDFKKIPYQTLEMLAFKHVMYKIPVQRHSAVSSKMYHLRKTQK